MSELVLEQADSQGYINGYVNGVMFMYVKIREGAFKYQSTTEKEYTLQAVVDEDTADAWEEAFDRVKAKKIKTADFESKFGIEPPYPEDKNQYMITVRAYHAYEDGTPVPYEKRSRPKVYVPCEKGGDVKDITLDLDVGNGSLGDIAITAKENSYGLFPKLTAILVKDLIEYEGKSGGNSAFGHVANAEEANSKAPVAEAAPKQEQQEQPPVVEDYEDSDVPF